MNDYEREHSAVVRRAGAECAVLLKSRGDFPLAAPCTVALFGSGARRTVKGGTGSGEVNSRSSVSVEQGLEAAGFTVSSKFWLDSYDDVRRDAHKAFVRTCKEEARARRVLAAVAYMGAVMPEPEYNIPLSGAGDTAIYVLGRISGEGSDRRPVPGDILLSETEVRDILALRERYEHFLLVLNVGGVVDLSPVMAVENILYLSQLGAETGNVLADLLLGRACPSGKLTTTWAAWGDYQSIGGFGDRDDTDYREGVYVGYRYFDSAHVKPLFPFGFGLGYTDFAIKAGEARVQGEQVTVTASVTNVGARPGRETVQLYASAPTAWMDKPYQSLAAFAKTQELQPGESGEVTLRFAMRELASFDAAQKGWVLEKGDYLLRLGNSSADTRPAAVLRLDKPVFTERVRPAVAAPDFTDWAPERKAEKTPRFVKVLRVKAADIETVKYDYGCRPEADPVIAALSDEEAALMNVGGFDPKGGVLSVIGSASRTVAGAAGETTRALLDRGIPSLVMADGPAGLRLSRRYVVDENGAHGLEDGLPESVTEWLPEAARLFLRLTRKKPAAAGEVFEQYATAIPIGTAVAQSWNEELAEELGNLVGAEMERFGVHLWLAPALNIHRDLRCGRNFEYFSEDPLISGRIAAAITRGVQKHPGCGATVKHYAANNQETNRYASNSRMSERALREIYLRGFGICVREGRPHALMTSYNLLNGVHTSERRGILERVLRREFGFDGVVMTDWVVAAMSGKGGKYGRPDPARVAAAGNDLFMPGGRDDLNALLRGLRKRKVSRGQLDANATRVYRLAKKLVK